MSSHSHCSPVGTSAEYHSSSPSLKQQPYPLAGRSSPGNDKSSRAESDSHVEGLNGRNLILCRNRVFRLIQDHSTNKLRDGKNLGMAPPRDPCDSLNNPFPYGSLCFCYYTTEEALGMSMWL